MVLDTTHYGDNDVHLQANNDIDIVLKQAPENVTKTAAQEALTICVGNITDAIALLWERTAPASTTQSHTIFLDPQQEKWASVRDISDSILLARQDLTVRDRPK